MTVHVLLLCAVWGLVAGACAADGTPSEERAWG